MSLKKFTSKKIVIWSLVSFAIFFAAARAYYVLTDDFRISNITYGLPYEERWETPASTPEQEALVEQALDQDYYYIGKGAQSYAFASADGKYVLKFFKFKHLRPSFFIDSLPAIGPLKTYKETQQARKQRKLYGVFHSYRLAYDVDKDESGLHYVQLNINGNPKRQVTVIDKLGLKRTIELDSVPFVIQDKGTTLRTVIRSHLNKGDIGLAKRRFGQILDMYAREYAKGVYDHDHGVMQNTGFVGDRPFHLDAGKLLHDDAMVNKTTAKKDALLVVETMNRWTNKYFPDYAPQIKSYLDAKIRLLFD